MTDWGCEEKSMKENRVITIDEEIFRTKAFEVMDQLIDDGLATVGLVSTLIFLMLQKKLFYPEKESKEKESEKKEQE